MFKCFCYFLFSPLEVNAAKKVNLLLLSCSLSIFSVFLLLDLKFSNSIVYTSSLQLLSSFHLSSILHSIASPSFRFPPNPFLTSSSSRSICFPPTHQFSLEKKIPSPYRLSSSLLPNLVQKAPPLQTRARSASSSSLPLPPIVLRALKNKFLCLFVKQEEEEEKRNEPKKKNQSKGKQTDRRTRITHKPKAPPLRFEKQ